MHAGICSLIAALRGIMQFCNVALGRRLGLGFSFASIIVPSSVPTLGTNTHARSSHSLQP